jgi:hypothetical protein
LSKHTPGPWKVFWAKRRYAFIGIGTEDGEGITDPCFNLWRGDGEEAAANARLIAAAPDLLAAIMNSDDAHWTPAMRAAVKKALDEPAFASAK